MRFFRIGCKVLRVTLVLGFSLMSLGFLYTSVADDEFARRGGFWITPVPLLFAIAANLLFGRMAKWADKQLQ